MSELNNLKNSLTVYFEEVDPVLFFDEYLARLINVLKSSNRLGYSDENSEHIGAIDYTSGKEHRAFIDFLLKSLHSFNRTTENDNAKLMEYANSITRWIMHRKQDIPSRIEEILENRIVLHQNYLARAKYLTNEYRDPIYAPILLIPELFSLFCSILDADGVENEYKMEISLALVYLVSPIDLLPENFINHPLSLLDDLFLMLGAFRKDIALDVIDKSGGDISLILKIENVITQVKQEFGENSILSIHDAVMFVRAKSQSDKN